MSNVSNASVQIRSKQHLELWFNWLTRTRETGLTYLHLKCIFNEQIQMNGLCFTLRDYTSVSTLYFSLIDLKGYNFFEVALQKQLFKIQINHFQSRVQQIVNWLALSLSLSLYLSLSHTHTHTHTHTPTLFSKDVLDKSLFSMFHGLNLVFCTKN